MKKIWSAPEAIAEQFAANEYVAACGDNNVVYYFKCNAGSRNKQYNVYLANGDPYCTSGKDYGGYERRGWDYYKPCGSTHEADSDSGFLSGYMYEQNRHGGNTGERIDVIIWTENNKDCHCTTNLDMDQWETAKS